MSFLDKVKAEKATTAPVAATPAATKSNPLLKVNPLLGKKPEPAVTAPATTPAAAPVAEKKVNPLLGGAKKPVLTSTPAPAEKVEAKEEVKKTAINPFAKKTTPVKEESDPIAEAGAQKAVEAAKEELEAKTETVEEKVEETSKVEAAPVTPVTEKAAPAPTSRKKTSGAKKPTATATIKEEISDSADDSESPLVIPHTAVNYAEALEGIRSSFEDAEWDALKAEVEEKMANIVIAADMTPATLKQAVADLAEIRSTIESPYEFFKNQYESLASEKPEGLIMQIKGIAYTNNDKNDMDRRRAGIIACMNYVDKNGKSLNLYEVLDETRERYTFLQSKMNSIDYKSRALITMNGALKIEERLS